MRKPADFLTPTIKDLPPSGIRRFFDLVAETKGVISLGVGEPDFVTPWHIREASIHSLGLGYTSYTSNQGMPELRREIAGYLTRYQLEYDWSREIMVTVGASEGIDLALRAVLEPGDEVLIPDPTYVSYSPCTILAGGKPVMVPTTARENFKLKPEALKKQLTERSKVLLMCYPNNPTGAVMSKEDLLLIAKIAEEHDLLVIADEIYAELNYNGGHTSFASLPGMKERTILVSGFSKAFAMTGWRVGYACAPQELIEAMVKIHQYTILCAPIMSQTAALEALKNGREETEEMSRQYNQRRRLVYSRLLEMGLECFEPKGAFYIFPSVAVTGMDGEQFAQRLLEEEKVAVVPGSAFGSQGESHVRISYAASLEQLNQALDRIERFVARYFPSTAQAAAR